MWRKCPLYSLSWEEVPFMSELAVSLLDIIQHLMDKSIIGWWDHFKPRFQTVENVFLSCPVKERFSAGSWTQSCKAPNPAWASLPPDNHFHPGTWYGAVPTVVWCEPDRGSAVHPCGVSESSEQDRQRSGSITFCFQPVPLPQTWKRGLEKERLKAFPVINSNFTQQTNERINLGWK